MNKPVSEVRLLETHQDETGKRLYNFSRLLAVFKRPASPSLNAVIIMTKTAILIVGVFQNTDTEIRALFYLEDLLQAHVVTGIGSQQVPAELVVLFPRASVYVRNVPESDLLLILERLERNDPNAFAGIGPWPDPQKLDS
jgi:hypothetical protein